VRNQHKTIGRVTLVIRRICAPYFIRLLLVSIAVLAVTFFTLDRLFPIPLPPANDGVMVVSHDGTPLRAYPTTDGVWRYRISVEDVSPNYLQALLAYEDQYFYQHPGINPLSFMRAAWQWVESGRIISGGSTLTMQVARILDGPADRTILAKTKQMARALQLEMHLSKREILTIYLNHAPMGGIVEGVEMASRMYLNKSAKSLSVAEGAMLAVLPQSPTRNRPDTQPKRSEAARNKVLDRLSTLGYLSSDDVADAKIERVIAQPIRAEWRAPLAAERLKKNTLAATGVIATTLDSELQSQIETLVADKANTLPSKVSIAAMVMENDTLAVRAYVGSADFANQERAAHVDMARGVRSPGSTLKPFLYAMALDDGLIHSESLLVDAPQSFGGYAPGNFQASFSGAVSVSEALQRSLNVPAVDVLTRVGAERFTATLRGGGVRLRMEQGATPNLSVILGGAGTTLEELVGAYRAFAAGGVAGRPRLTPSEPMVETRLMSEGAAWIVREILETGGRPDRPFDDGGTRGGFAWKTGTSFGFRDAWAIGVTDRYTVGVWMGRPDGTPNPGFFGANSAAPLARDIAAILPIVKGVRAPRPSSVTAADICWPLGVVRDPLTPNLCHQSRRAWVINDVAPPTLPDRGQVASLRETIHIDTKTKLRVNAVCATIDSSTLTSEVARWPSHLSAWLPADLAEKSRVTDWRSDCGQRQASSIPMAIRGIEHGSLITATAQAKSATNSATNLATSAVKLNLSAIGTSGNVYWLHNGLLLANQPVHKNIQLTLAQNGRHDLTAIDDTGRHARVSFSVKGFSKN
jgi:penicillin-binding protein 1C